MLYNVAFTMYPLWAPSLYSWLLPLHPCCSYQLSNASKSFPFPSSTLCSFSMCSLSLPIKFCLVRFRVSLPQLQENQSCPFLSQLVSPSIHPSIHSFIHHAKNVQTQSHEKPKHTYIHSFIHSFILENENQKKSHANQNSIHSLLRRQNQNCSLFIVHG